MGDFRAYMLEETLAQVRLRVAARMEPDDRMAVRLATDLVQTVHVGTLQDCHLASENAWLDRTSVDDVRAAASMNTSVELLSTRFDLTTIERGTWRLTSPSYSTGAIVTMLDGVPTPHGRPLDMRRGVLVAVPTARVVLFGLADDPSRFLRHATCLHDEALALRDDPDFVSASVYLADEGGLRRVAHSDWQDGRTDIHFDPPPGLAPDVP